MPDSLVCTRAIQGGSFSSEPGPTRFLKVPDKKNPAPSHQINRTNFIEEVVGTPSAQKCEDIVVFVHCFNVTQADLIQRHRSIRTGLAKAGFKGEVLSFDRPAKGSVAKSNTPCNSVLKLSSVKRFGVARRAGRVGLPESAPAKAVGVNCDARFLKAHPSTKWSCRAIYCEDSQNSANGATSRRSLWGDDVRLVKLICSRQVIRSVSVK